MKTICAPILLFLLAVPAQATVILSNLGTTPNAGVNYTTTTFRRAEVFTVSSQNISVDSVVLGLNGYNSSSSDVFSVSIYEDNGFGTNTGALVGTFTAPPGNSGAISNFTFTPSSPLTLTAGSTYWMVGAYGSGDGFISWNAYTSGPDPTGTGATYVKDMFSSSSGASWTEASAKVIYQINGTLVPEPSRALLLLGGLVSIALQRRRRA